MTLDQKPKTVPKKTCTKCGVEYPKTSRFFYFRENKRKRVLRSECKKCRRKWVHHYRWKGGRRPYFVEAWLKNRYGITQADWDRIFEKQGGKCAICKNARGYGNRDKLAVDHDHTSGIVRGLLCHFCNQGLGAFKDDPVLVRAAADYLLSHAPCVKIPRRGGRLTGTG